jgi:hypothetical protein
MSGDAAADPGLPATVRDSGATPWVSLVFRTPPPLAQSSDRLQAELRAAADFAGKAPAGTWFQIVWRPETGEFSPTEYAFLLKRAAVAVTGAQTDAKVATGPMPADPDALKAFYGEEAAAYLEALTLQPAGAEGMAAAVAAVQELDPGRTMVLDALPMPEPPIDPAEVLSSAARYASVGIDLTLFRAPGLPRRGSSPHWRRSPSWPANSRETSPTIPTPRPRGPRRPGRSSAARTSPCG